MKPKQTKKKTKPTLPKSGALVSKRRTPEEVALSIKKQLKDPTGLVPVRKVKVKNPLTGKTGEITIRMDGTQESELASALVDPKATRAQKDHLLSMYLFDRGADSASFMMDIIRSKGAHTKETRVFKSQVRFDLEMFVELFANHLEGQAMRTAKNLGISLQKELSAYRGWLSLSSNKGKEYTYYDFVVANSGNSFMSRTKLPSREYCALVSQAMFDIEQAQKFDETHKALVNARLKDQGKGVYVDAEGKVYSVNDPELDDIIKADREATAEINNEDI